MQPAQYQTERVAGFIGRINKSRTWKIEMAVQVCDATMVKKGQMLVTKKKKASIVTRDKQ